MPVNDYLVPLLTCTLTDVIVCLETMLICCCLLNTIIVIIIEFWDFSWSLLCYTLVSVLVLGIGIARGQYYWVLDIGCLSWYRSNPTNNILKTCPLKYRDSGTSKTELTYFSLAFCKDSDFSSFSASSRNFFRLSWQIFIQNMLQK